jgi:transposase
MSHYIGIDVSKKRLDVDWLGQPKSYSNDKLGIRRLIRKLQNLKAKNKLSLAICEATGGYEKKLVKTCHQADIAIHVAHANKVRYFAKSQGLFAKTDKLDARVLSNYGCLMHSERDEVLLDKNAEKINGFLRRREQLQADKKRELNRMDKIEDVDIKRSINSHINWLNKKIKDIESKLKELKNKETISRKHDLLTTIPAIGDISAYYLLAHLPELGKFSNKALTALVGVAPFNSDSGASQSKRFIQGGRSRLRQILYMTGITAIRCNKPLKEFYMRLRTNGKPVKVAIVAVIRKLITMANSVLKRGTPWKDKYEWKKLNCIKENVNTTKFLAVNVS